MDIILERAKDMAYDASLDKGQGSIGYRYARGVIKMGIDDIYDQLDKIRVLQYLSEVNVAGGLAHELVCGTEDCQQPKERANLSYYLTEELNKLDVIINPDAFTSTEKEMYESKIDELLKRVEELKIHNEIIYEEITELRGLYFLGKKKWYQLFLGKGAEMVAGGIISETVSKELIYIVASTIKTIASN